MVCFSSSKPLLGWGLGTAGLLATLLQHLCLCLGLCLCVLCLLVLVLVLLLLQHKRLRHGLSSSHGGDGRVPV